MGSDQRPSPPVKGVVIITLPPSNNPSIGKTITAFTLFNPPQFHQTSIQEQPHLYENQRENFPPVQSAINPSHLQFSSRRLFRKNTFLFLGICLFAIILYSASSIFPQTFDELRRSDDDDDEGPKTFLFPLYPKSGVFLGVKDVQLKLGRFMDVDKEKLVVAIDDGLKENLKVSTSSSSGANLGSSTILPVRGNIYPDGLYYTFILVGNPPRPYFLDVDTGSDLTWIQCDAPCSSCAKGRSPLYKPTRNNVVPFKDSFCKEVQRNNDNGNCETCHQCNYEIEYADKSSSLGVLAKDKLHLVLANGSLTKSDIIFGCAYDQQGLLLNTMSKTDGILGLSRAKISLPSQLAMKGVINHVVGHCLSSDLNSGGYMFMGDDLVPQTGMTWVPMFSNSPSIDYYHSKIVKINYGTSPLSVSGGRGRLVFDSGSSYTYFTSVAYSELLASLNEVSTFGLIQNSSDSTLPICWQAKFPIRSVADVKKFFKPLTLMFGSRFWIFSTKLEIPPEGYLIISNKGNVCLGILDGSEVHDGSAIILGDISLRGRVVIYDNVNQKIGWARSDCQKPERVNSLAFF